MSAEMVTRSIEIDAQMDRNEPDGPIICTNHALRKLAYIPQDNRGNFRTSYGKRAS